MEYADIYEVLTTGALEKDVGRLGPAIHVTFRK